MPSFFLSFSYQIFVNFGRLPLIELMAGRKASAAISTTESELSRAYLFPIMIKLINLNNKRRKEGSRGKIVKHGIL